MKVFCSGTARIEDNDTGVIYEIKPQELDWEEDGMGEGSMGVESEHRAVIEHPYLGVLAWRLGEYPEGVQDYKRTEVGDHKLIEDFTYGLHHES